MMDITIISDLHGSKPALHGGDLLIICGDLTARDTPQEHYIFEEWLEKQDYLKKIVIAGNHDGFLEKYGKHMFAGVCDYLQDSGINWWGLNIWGMPWTPPFCNWHFMADKKLMKEKVNLIPDDTDILISHGPPYGILDKNSRHRCGCMELIDTIPRLSNLKLHTFGHIHEGYGIEEIRKTIFVNASLMNANYDPVNAPIRIEL